jgi:hypothetical protein
VERCSLYGTFKCSAVSLWLAVIVIVIVIIMILIILQLAGTPDRDIHLISAVDRPEYSHCCVFVFALWLTCCIVADFTLDQTTNRHPLWYSPYLVIQDIYCGIMSLQEIYLTTLPYLRSLDFIVSYWV